MLTIRFLAIVLGGIVFIIIGYFLRREKKFLGFIFFIIGLFLTYVITIGPLSKSHDIILSITKIDSEQVKSIKILPCKENEKNLANSEILIEDKFKIRTLCNGLNKAHEEGEGFIKSPDWKCIIVLNLKSYEQIKFEVRGKDDITGLFLNSNGDSGWHYGNLRADEFGRSIIMAAK